MLDMYDAHIFLLDDDPRLFFGFSDDGICDLFVAIDVSCDDAVQAVFPSRIAASQQQRLAVLYKYEIHGNEHLEMLRHTESL